MNEQNNMRIDTEKMEKSLFSLIETIKSGNNCFLLGGGGVGKTLSQKYIAAYFENKKKIGMTAATGIAAINLSVSNCKGRTLHSWAGVGLARENSDKLAANIMKVRPSFDKNVILNAHDRWLRTDLLFIDEISMIGLGFLEKLDNIGRIVRNKPDKAFGGMQLVFSGDWMQLPPVKDDWCFLYKRWDEFQFKHFIFSTPLRFQKNKKENENKYEIDDRYFHLLSRIRQGIIIDQDKEILKERIKAYDLYLQTPLTLTDIKPTVLFPLKIEVWSYNKNELDKLPTPLVLSKSHDIYTSLSKRWPLSEQQMKDRFQTQLDDMIPNCVELKIGAQVMLKKNLDFSRKLVNGSRGVITNIISKKNLLTSDPLIYNNEIKLEMLKHYNDENPIIIEVKFFNGEEERIIHHSFKYENDDVSAVRISFPLVLAWCLTVHSSQGSTIDYAVCDLGAQNFASGQAYVSLSRVKNLDGLLVSKFVDSSIKVDTLALEKLKSIEYIGEKIEFPSDLFF